MKYFLSLLVLCLSFHSCSVDSSVPDDYDHQGKWDLVRSRSNVAHEKYVEESEISESYIFRHNGTFLKMRIQRNLEESVGGTYKLVKSQWTGAGEPLLFMELKFEAASPLISNCTPEPVEHLILTSKYILENTWMACDGSQMEYQKEEQPDY